MERSNVEPTYDWDVSQISQTGQPIQKSTAPKKHLEQNWKATPESTNISLARNFVSDFSCISPKNAKAQKEDNCSNGTATEIDKMLS